MRGEPDWDRNQILQLHWVHDEIFVTPRLWSTVFEPAGVWCRPVLDTRGRELSTVVQLAVEETVELLTDDLPSLRCVDCGRTRYLPSWRGAFPAVRRPPTGAMVRTSEHMAIGAQAANHLLVSQDLARSLADAAVRGVSLRPSQPLAATTSVVNGRSCKRVQTSEQKLLDRRPGRSAS